jgi:hypothetical protein
MATVTYAFANTNTVNPSKAGDGDGAVSGYTVDVSYTLDATDPDEVSAVVLDFDTAPGTAKITFDDTTWTDCGADGTATQLTCTLASNVTVLSITTITVVAAD